MTRKPNPRILAIDDDSSVLKLLGKVFEETGRFTFVGETDACQAVQVAQLFQPDLLLVDVNMPGRTGIQVAMLLRAEPWLRYQPIVFFTGVYTRGVPRCIALGDGATAFLAKGVPTQLIVETVDRLLAAEQSALLLRA
ncbi:MAG: hypothetical protein QOE70_4065 [Chthoniobacter sp.]|nr:hypothetical protein [Chthoniobacter sp.]